MPSERAEEERKKTRRKKPVNLVALSKMNYDRACLSLDARVSVLEFAYAHASEAADEESRCPPVPKRTSFLVLFLLLFVVFCAGIAVGVQLTHVASSVIESDDLVWAKGEVADKRADRDSDDKLPDESDDEDTLPTTES